MTESHLLKKIIFIVSALLALSPWVNSGMGLLLGIAVALIFGNPYSEKTKKWTPNLLALSVMGLGAGMNLKVVAQVGLQGVGYTVIGITMTVLIGTLIGKKLKTPNNTSVLINVGTAICGGSAIAAVAPVLRAKAHEVSVALATVFLLNAVALFTFPAVGHFFSMTESQFGLWCALAIHDTSSVVGASLQYGGHALEIGTSVKLARALWIVPVTFFFAYLKSRKQREEVSSHKVKKPWFILGFIIVAALVTWIPNLQPAGHQIENFAKHSLILTLFLIGSSLSKENLKSVGFRPFAHGALLWVIVASLSLSTILCRLIQI